MTWRIQAGGDDNGEKRMSTDVSAGPAGEGTRKLRVAHVIDSLAGSGGAENRLVEEVIALRGRFDQVVVRLFEDGFLDHRLTQAGVPVAGLGLRASGAARTWPLAARRLRRLLEHWRPDVVHSSLLVGNLVGQLAATRLGVPVVSTFNRTGDVDRLRSLRPGVASWRGRATQAVAVRVARRSCAHYRAVGRHVLESNCASLDLPAERASLIPRGVDVSSVQAPSRAELGLPADVPLVVNVGRLVPEKAQHLLVEAFAAARDELPGARLLIAGTAGANQLAVRAAVERHRLDGAVQLLGFRPDARALVAAADVFAFSSLAEGSPGAVVEALRLGIPVAAFDIAPVLELTGDGEHAWLAPAGSVGALARSIVAACRAPDRQARADASRAWAERFSVDTVADRLGDLLQARADAGRPAR